MLRRKLPNSVAVLRREPWNYYHEKRLKYLKARNKGNSYISRPEVRIRIFGRDSYTCKTCGSKRDLTLDHITAIFDGGEPDNDDNLQTLCRKCNSAKPLINKA